MLKSDITKPDKNIPHTPKIAIFYDWLNQWGGAERLLLDILQVFPQAKLFTTIHNPTKTSWLKQPVTASFLNKFCQNNSPLVSLIQPIAVENFDFSSFDIVLSLTSQNGKALLTSPQTCHICYLLTPNRYLYQYTYPKLLNKFINYFKGLDFIYSQRPDYYITISQTVQNRIKNLYKKDSIIVYPPIDPKFKPPITPANSNYYLVVSRLVKHKRVDLAIATCLRLGKNLYIVGSGRYQNQLKKIANHSPLISFLGQAGDRKLLKLYQNCSALICPQIEDFGLTSVEVQACGKPVIGLNKAGIKETVINNQTGVLFRYQTVKSISIAIKKFESLKIDPLTCRQNALKFSRQIFMVNFRNQVEHLWRLHSSQNLAPTS